MRLILEFDKFKPEYRPIRLCKKGYYLVNFDSSKTEEKEKLIRSILNEYYPEIKKSDSIDIDGKILSSEILNKSQKNIKILYVISDIMLNLNISVDLPDDVINFIRDNSYDLFNVNGLYFDEIYNALKEVSESGLIKERKGSDLFKRYALSKGFEVEILPPDTSSQDIEGVDAYFKIDKTTYTIQIKTLDSVDLVEDFYHVFINGDLTKIKTNYLVLVLEDDKKSSSNREYIFKGSYIKTEFEVDGKSYYIVPSSNLLYSE